MIFLFCLQDSWVSDVLTLWTDAATELFHLHEGIQRVAGFPVWSHCQYTFKAFTGNKHLDQPNAPLNAVGRQAHTIV